MAAATAREGRIVVAIVAALVGAFGVLGCLRFFVRGVLFQLRDEFLHVAAGGFQLQREEEQLALVDLLALLPETPHQQLFEDMLHALIAPLVDLQLSSEIDHHLPQQIGVIGQAVEVHRHYTKYTVCCGENEAQNALEAQ